MTFDLDIYHAAKLLIGRHGDEAALYAAGRADLLLQEGDIEGAAAWRAIVGAIEELQRECGPDGRAVQKDSLMQPILPSLSPEEASILRALRRGLTNEVIASLHGLDIETVQLRCRAIMTKLHARSRAEVMKAASDLIVRAALDRAASRGESAPSRLKRAARESGEIDTAIKRRFWVTASSAFVGGVFSVVTPIWPDWIEWIFGADPDGDNGFMEWAIVICLVTITAVLSFVAAGEWRRIPHRRQS